MLHQGPPVHGHCEHEGRFVTRCIPSPAQKGGMCFEASHMMHFLARGPRQLSCLDAKQEMSKVYNAQTGEKVEVKSG